MECRAQKEGILLQGGERFYLGDPEKEIPHVRLSVSRVEQKEIIGSFEKLRKLWKGKDHV